MSQEAIQAIAAIQPGTSVDFDALQPMAAADGALRPENGFGQLVSQGLQEVNKKLLTNQTDLQQLALGDAQNLHQIMIRMEETRMSFQLLLQVRNRLLEAYQDVMKMQV